MFTRTKENQLDKAKRTLRDVVSYAQDVIEDERLRADVRAAIDLGATAGERIRRDIRADGISQQLTTDKKLRKNLSAMLDDLDSAGDRLRRKRRHRVRNVLLMLVGGVAALVALPKIRPWLAEQKSQIVGAGGSEPEPVI
jgi:hypothetical protein